MRRILSYSVTYLPRNMPKKYVKYESIYAENRDQVEIIIHNVYPEMLDASWYKIGDGFIPSKILASEGKVSYLDDVVKREIK